MPRIPPDTLLVFTLFGALTLMARASGQESIPYLDPSLPLETRLDDLLARLTLEEKAAQWVHNAPAIERLGIAAYNWWSEALHGVARAGHATVFPQAIGLASMWDPALMEQIGTAVSDEARAKHHAFVRLGERAQYQGLTFWSPNINLFRDPRWGRGMETFGEDPFLTGKTGAAFIRGLQGNDPQYLKVVGTMKHFAVHSGPEPERHTFNAAVDERDLRESYLPHFLICVREANVQSVMCAYNRFAGEPCCGSNRLLAEILRGEWGFNGYVTSDCGAIGDIFRGHRVRPDAAGAAAMAIRAGTDLNCSFDDAAPLEAVRRGLLSEAELDTAIRRLFRARFMLGMFDPPERVPFTSIPPSVVGSAQHHALALTAARKSIVLLQNKGSILPLRKDVHSIAVIGPNADDVLSLLGNYYGVPDAPVTPLEGIRRILPGASGVLHAPGCRFAEGVPLLQVVGPAVFSHDSPSGRAAGLSAEFFAGRTAEGAPLLTRTDGSVDFNWCIAPPLQNLDAPYFTVRWSGYLEPPATGQYHIGTFGFSGFSLSIDDSVVAASMGGSEVPIHAPVVLTGGQRYHFRLEGTCRRSGSLVRLLWEVPHENRIDEALRIAREADVAVLVLGLSPRIEGEEMNVEVPGFRGGDRTSIGLPEPQEQLLKRVTEAGKPVVLVLMNGSPLTVAWASAQVPAIVEAWYPGQAGGTAIAEVLFGDVNPSGRLPLTFYRSTDDLPPFDQYAMAGRTYRFFQGTPLYPFGHGLSYTRFEYGDLRLSMDSLPASPGAACTVTVDIRNAGVRAGDEVAQMYIRPPGTDPRRAVMELRGFRRVSLDPGERRPVTFTLTSSDCATFDPEGRQWTVQPGEYTVCVGASSGDIRATGVLTIR